MSSAIAQCKEVSPECPVQLSIYGSYLSLGGNAFFLAAFLILLLIQLGIGVWKRTWTYTLAVSLGCLGESLGYIGRVIESNNPFSIVGIGMNILCLVVSPSFMAAGIYLTLKHVVLYCGEEYSRLKPKWFPRIFILCDVCSILIQAIGGALDATAQDGDPNLINTGNALIITGIVLQVVTMSIFGLLALEYCMHRRTLATSAMHKLTHERREASSKSRVESESADEKTSDQSIDKHARYNPAHFKYFLCGIIFAYSTIMIRCIYRIVEMAGGWKGPIMRNEPAFLVLDGAMILLAAIALTAAHPGIFFTPMSKGNGGW